MSVSVVFRGGLGENLFQYEVGRRLAERLGLALTCVEPTLTGMHDRAANPPLHAVVEALPLVTMTHPGLSVDTPVEEYSHRTIGNWDGQSIPLGAILSNSDARRIVLEGYFQRYAEYIAPVLDRLRRLYAVQAPWPDSALRLDERAVTIVIWRTPQYAMRGWLVPLPYYDEALRTCGPVERVYVCGPGLSDAVKVHFERYAPTYLDCSAIQLLAVLGHSRRIVLANATLPWWGAVLSHATRIVGPATSDPAVYAFAGYPGVDLDLREARYSSVQIQGVARGQVRIRSLIAGGQVFRLSPSVCVVYGQARAPVTVHAPVSLDRVLARLSAAEHIAAAECLVDGHGGAAQSVLPWLVTAGLVSVQWVEGEA
jgi:hypothetical protein